MNRPLASEAILLNRQTLTFKQELELVKLPQTSEPIDSSKMVARCGQFALAKKGDFKGPLAKIGRNA